ncbi:hypothetical protein R6Q57_011069 [Mikania cordata]
MMYPRFLQMIFDERFPNLQRGVVTRDLKLLSESTFPMMMQNRGGKYKFERLHPLKKFGQFAETEDVDASEATKISNAVIEEDHDVQVMGSKSSDEDVYVVHPPEYEEVVTGNEPDLDFYFEMETIPVEGNRPEQVNLLTIENIEALLEHVKRSVGNPPLAFSFTDQEPPLDAAADLVPRLRRKRDPRPGIVVNNEAKDRKIKDLETNMGHLSAIVLDMKEKLQEKFKEEFLDESSSSTAVEPEPEMSRADFDELNRS